jgi:hypothetical protein
MDQKKLQKKRAKREQKRRQAKTGSSGGQGLLAFSRDWAWAAQGEIADILVPANLFDTGKGTLWFSRKLPDGRHAVAAFLLDVHCLGVKDALYKIAEVGEYPNILERIYAQAPGEMERPQLERQHPSCARKLIEKTAAYAKDLGFEPHADYRIARMIFGDIDASACPESFTFGKDGKPFYVDGPNDTPAMKKRIVKQLERRCGPGGYDYMISVANQDDDLL